MEVPRVFFGTSSQVGGRFRKFVTELRRGASLEELLAASELVELDDFPKHLVCMWAGRGGLGGEHVRIDQLSRVIFWGSDLEHGRLNEIREATVDFLASSAWGCLVLNTPQAYSGPSRCR